MNLPSIKSYLGEYCMKCDERRPMRDIAVVGQARSSTASGKSDMRRKPQHVADVAGRETWPALRLHIIDDLDAVAVGVMKIGVAARKRDVTLVGIADERDAARFHDRERPVELLPVHDESVMMGF